MYNMYIYIYNKVTYVFVSLVAIFHLVVGETMFIILRVSLSYSVFIDNLERENRQCCFSVPSWLSPSPLETPSVFQGRIPKMRYKDPQHPHQDMASQGIVIIKKWHIQQFHLGM